MKKIKNINVDVEDAINFYKARMKYDEVDEQSMEQLTDSIQELIEDFEGDYTNLNFLKCMFNLIRFHQYGDTSDTNDIEEINEDLASRYELV